MFAKDLDEPAREPEKTPYNIMPSVGPSFTFSTPGKLTMIEEVEASHTPITDWLRSMRFTHNKHLSSHSQEAGAMTVIEERSLSGSHVDFLTPISNWVHNTQEHQHQQEDQELTATRDLATRDWANQDMALPSRTPISDWLQSTASAWAGGADDSLHVSMSQISYEALNHGSRSQQSVADRDAVVPPSKGRQLTAARASPFLSAVPTTQCYVDVECTKSVLSVDRHHPDGDVPAFSTPVTDLIQKSKDASHSQLGSDQQSSSQKGLHNPGLTSATFGVPVGTCGAQGASSHEVIQKQRGFLEKGAMSWDKDRLNWSGEGQSAQGVGEYGACYKAPQGGGVYQYFDNIASSHVSPMPSLPVRSVGQRSTGGAPTASPTSQSSRLASRSVNRFNAANHGPKMHGALQHRNTDSRVGGDSNPGLLIIPPATHHEPVKDASPISLVSMEPRMPKRAGLNVGVRFGSSAPASDADLYAYRPPQCPDLSRVITYREDGSESFQLPPSWIVLRPEDCPLVWIVLRSGTVLPNPDTYGTLAIDWLVDATTMTCAVMGQAPAISSLGADQGLLKPPMESIEDTHVSLVLEPQCGRTIRRWLACAQRMGIAF